MSEFVQKGFGGPPGDNMSNVTSLADMFVILHLLRLSTVALILLNLI